jgi:type I restriction enzyme M protein
MAGTNSAEIGKIIDNAMTAIEKENTKLKGVLPKNFARPELDKRRLGEVVDIFTNISTASTGELSGLFAQSRKLETEIRKRLGAIGYEI